jgi:hypothetical protein
MVGNQRLEELDILGRIAILPCVFISAVIFHFANLYTGRSIKWAIALVWGFTGMIWMPILAGAYYKIEGYYSYDWGNIFKVAPSVLDPLTFVFWFGVNLWACWLLYKSARKKKSPLKRRHYWHIILGFLAVTFTVVKTLVTMGINAPFLLPLGMFLSDIFVSTIGLAIIKDRLFDITVIIKKGALYSALAGLLIFAYSFTEHILITYIGEKIGETSTVVHLISIAVGTVILLPVKSSLERAVDKYFAHKKLAF